MADDENSIRISITLDDGSVREGFARIKKSGQDSGDGIAESFTKLKQQILGLYVVKQAFDFIKEGFTDAMHQARESEHAINGMNLALASAGRYSKQTSQEFQDLAERMQEQTTISYDTVLGMEKLAITYTKTNAQALKLTETAVNFAAVTDGDVNGALTQLAGTLSGTAGRLAKLYPELQQFTAGQLKAGAAVDYFNSRFAGQAAGLVNTYDGRVAQLKNTYDDLLKMLGKLVTMSPSVIATIKAVTDLLKTVTSDLKKSIGGQDIFKDLIINFSVIAQAGTETARRIGLSFELAYLRAKQAWYAFKVVSTAGFSEAFNQQLQDVLDQIEKVKSEFGQDSAITQWFDTLILKVQQAGAVTKDVYAGMGGHHDELSAKNYTLLQSFRDLGQGARDSAQEMADNVSKNFRQLGMVAIQGLANATAQGMAAIGKALVKGEDIFQAFAGAVLSALGQAAIQMGATYILMGIARAWASYGADATAWKLIATGGALSVLGGALMALGSGGSSAGVSVGEGGGGGGAGAIGGGTVSEDPATSVKDKERQMVTVNIHGDVFDTAETGLRIVELVNNAFSTQGAQVLVK